MTNKLSAYSTTPASNNAGAPDGWPEGMTAGSLNNAMREYAARVQEWYLDPSWIRPGHSIQSSTASTVVVSGDQTGYYLTGRAIRLDQDQAKIGYVSSSSYSAPNTTVNVLGLTVSAPTIIEVSTVQNLAALPYEGAIQTSQLPSALVSGTPTLLDSASITAAASVDFGNVFAANSTYPYFIIAFENVRCSTSLLMRFSDDAGVSFESGAAYYAWLYQEQRTDLAAATEANDSSDASIKIDGYGSADSIGDGRITVMNAASATVLTTVQYVAHNSATGSGFTDTTRGTGTQKAASTITGFQLLAGSGSFTAQGSVRIYGSHIPY